MSTLNFAIVGTGGITLQNHLPGLAMCGDVKVTALCDTNPATLEAARQQTDWGTRPLGWRMVKKLAGTGELGDMLSHRINFAQFLIGPMRRLVANVKNLTPLRGGLPNDTEDWVAILADFQNGATGVLESSKLASGRNESWRSLDYVELNGSEGTFEFTTGKWNELIFGKVGGPGLAPLAVPREFWTWPGSPRDGAWVSLV